MVAHHVGMLVLEIAGTLFLWHFAAGAERESERIAEDVERERTETAAAQQRAALKQVDAERGRREELVAVAATLAAQAAGIERAQRAAHTATNGRPAATAAGTVQQLESSVSRISA